MKKHYGESIDKVVKSNDTISRKQAIETLIAKANAEGAYGYLDAKSIEDCLANMPPAEPERKTGKWITVDKGLIVTSYKCSECGRTVRDDTGYDVCKDYPYCHCGARME